MGRLAGKVAWITGAASGIGLACAQRFANEGATIIGSDLNACPDWDAICEISPRSVWRQLDVTDQSALEDALPELVEKAGGLHTVITAAGTAGGGAIHQISTEDWDRVMRINLNGTMLPVRTALPFLIEQRQGSIITVASVEGLEGSEGGSAYNASKGAVVLFTRNLAMDYGRLGIRANALCPGFIDTPMFREVFELEAMRPIRDKIAAQHKLGRFGRPEEIAGAAFFLASDDASFVTGQALAVDGGYTAGHSYGLVEMMGLS